MFGIIRIFIKDIFELLQGGRGIILAFILPPLLLIMVGQLNVQSHPVQLLVAGSPKESGQSEQFQLFLSLLKESSVFEVTTLKYSLVDPLTELNYGGYDILLNVGYGGEGNWSFYTAETDPSRVRILQQMVSEIEQIRLLMSVVMDDDKYARYLIQKIATMGTVSNRSFFTYYPQASDRSVTLIPKTIALIACFLPFVLSSSSLIRERETHMLEVLLAAPGIRLSTLFIGKCLLPMVVSLFNFVLMLIIAQSVFHLNVKSGFFHILPFLTPAILSSVLLGLAVSAVANSQLQSMMFSAIYFLSLTLFSGFLIPINEASGFVQGLSKLFPLTFLFPMLQGWMFGGRSAIYAFDTAGWLSVQCLVFGILSILSLRRGLHRI